MAVIRTDVSETMASVFRVPHGDGTLPLCYSGTTVDQRFLRGFLSSVEEHCFLGCVQGCTNYRRLLELCNVCLYLERTVRRSYRFHLQVREVPEDICHCYYLESIPEDSVLPPQIVSLYGEAGQQWFHGDSYGVISPVGWLKMEAMCSPKRRF
jgi:hypothetical protein